MTWFDELEYYIGSGGFVMGPLLIGTAILWFGIGWRALTLKRGVTLPLRDLVDQVDGSATTTEFLKKAESDRKFYSVGGDVKNGKNIFGENMFSNAEAENIAVGIKQKVQVKPDEEGNLIDFRAYGLDGGKPNPQDQKIPDENSVYFAMNEISKNGNYKERINEGNRAKVTQEATIKLANLIGIDPEKLKKTIQGRHSGGVIVGDQMGLAETMLAARQLLVNEVKKFL